MFLVGNFSRHTYTSTLLELRLDSQSSVVPILYDLGGAVAEKVSIDKSLSLVRLMVQNSVLLLELPITVFTFEQSLVVVDPSMSH